MSKSLEMNSTNDNRSRSVLELSHTEARIFFIKAESYCSFDLPPYIKFDPLLLEISTFLEKTRLTDVSYKPRDYEGLNHVIFNNKDGKYAWRPMQLIHPALYVSLVHAITEETNWQVICSRFLEFSMNPKIKCLSLPLEALSGETDKAEQVTNWWLEVEQKSIELALDYEFLAHADITDCYSAIYTHSVAWSLHTKEVAKKKENRGNKGLIGVLIDNHLQDMSHGQTNGIPQGSVLMDFIAEMVLGYADEELTKKLNTLSIENYQILRYRDDYRIFTNNPQECEIILKALTETLIDLGLKVNSSKTLLSSQVIHGSIKTDKLNWMMKVKSAKNLQKHLLLIHNHSIQFPNSGSLIVALSSYYKRLLNYKKRIVSPMPLISIAVDIAYHNPRTYPIISAILSKLISILDEPIAKKEVIKKIKRRFDQLPNTGHMQIWLQRVSQLIEKSIYYDEPICQLVNGRSQTLWNVDWITSNKFKKLLDSSKIIDQDEIESLESIVPLDEIELFLLEAQRYL